MKGRAEVLEVQRARELSVRLCLLVISETTPTLLPKHELNKEDTRGHAKCDEEKS